MASSFTHCSFHCHAHLSTNVTTSSAFMPTPFSASIFCGNTGFSLRRTSLNVRTCAKFEKFQGESSEDIIEGATASSLLENLEKNLETNQEDEDEDDSCLPSDLDDAVRQSGQASALFFSSGGMRAIVELLIPQLQYLDDEGAQVELWELSRIYLETLIEETGCQNVKAIFPDAGAAALLKHRWSDAAFRFASLSDRRPVENEDEIVVMVVPDHQMLSYVEKIAANLSDDPPRPLIMWNPRLISGDVGVGVNVRKLRRYFLSTFTPVYSMRPLTSGAVFRCYPGLWKVFYDDKDRPGRYLLAKEFITRPNTEDLEFIFGEAEQKSEDKRNFFDKAAGVFSSINRFMKAM